jgi:hypothetical protein
MGQMEYLVEFLARWQETSKPTLDNPMVAILLEIMGLLNKVCRHFLQV